MELHQRHSSSGSLNRTMSLERKQQHVVSQKDKDKLPKPTQIGSPDVSAGSKFKSRSRTGQTVKKPAAEAHRSLVDDDLDFDKQFDKGRCSSDNDDDCTWLSGGASPSTFFREYRLSSAYNVDSRLVSWLSKLADSYLSFTSKAEKNSQKQKTEDGSIKCPDQSLRKGCKEDLDNILLLNPDAQGISAWSRCSCEEATNCGCPLSPLSSCHDSSQVSDLGRTSSVISSQLSDIRRTNSTVSLVDEESHLDNLPGPSCQSIWCSEGKHNDIRHELVEPASPTEQSSEALKKSDCNGEEPIFWPFNQNWSSEESWPYFSMSPLKDRPRLGSAEGIFTPSIGLKHCGRSLQTQNGCRRNLVFNSIRSKDSENRNRKDNIKNTRSRAQRENSYPSRLEDSTKASSEVVPFDSDSHPIKQGHGNAAMLKSVYSSSFLEDGSSSNLELPIETVVGLEEFDGHEGIDSEFNEDIFLLDELC